MDLTRIYARILHVPNANGRSSISFQTRFTLSCFENDALETVKFRLTECVLVWSMCHDAFLRLELIEQHLIFVVPIVLGVLVLSLDQLTHDLLLDSIDLSPHGEVVIELFFHKFLRRELHEHCVKEVD